MKKDMEKFLKYIIWVGLVGICFIPLIVKGTYFFPYIVPKTLVFRIVVEIIFLAFLALAVIKKEYRPKFNLVLVLFLLYIAVVFVSSLLGSNFYYSFWSNNERSEGLLLLLHLFLFLVVLTGFLHRLKDWLIVFEFFFVSGLLVCLMALGQYFDLSQYVSLKWQWLLESSGGTRLASTIGNAGYVAGYLIFNIFFGLFLLFFRKNKYLRWYYISGILLQIFVVLNTLSRGGILALALSLIAFIGYMAFGYLKSNKLVRNTGIIILLLGIILAGSVFFNRQAAWVKNNPVLGRIASISTKAVTAQNRLMTWQASYQGFKEKPLLGYGYENFYQVIDKYFNPQIYRHVGSVVWFDRAHNFFLDRLITGGLIGWFLYLFLLLLPLWYLWIFFRQNKTASGYLIPIIFTLVMLAYFIQAFFIFEALVTYIPLFLVLGFLSRFSPSWPGKFCQSKKTWLVLLIISIVGFLPILIIANLKPAAVNKELIRAMIKACNGECQEAYDQFIKVIEKGAFNNQEYRVQFSKIVFPQPGDQAGTSFCKPCELDENWQSTAAVKVEEEFDKQIQEKPDSARNYVIFMRFLNRSYVFDPNRLNKSLALGKKALELSPTRPQIYYETAYSQVYLGNYYQSAGQTETAQTFFDQSIASMQKAIDLNDRVVESYVNMVMLLLVSDRGEQVQFYLDKMDEKGLDYHLKNRLALMANGAFRSENYQWARRFYEELIELYPKEPDYWFDLAKTYAYLGQREQAIETAGKVKEFGGEYVEQAESLIQDILAGIFER